MVKRLRNKINLESLKKLADSLCTSKLRYGLSLFGKIRWTEEDINPKEFKDLQLNQITQWCASTLGAALLCKSRAGSDLGLVSRWVEGFVNWVPLPRLGPAVDCDGVTALQLLDLWWQYRSEIFMIINSWTGTRTYRASSECLLEFDKCSIPLSHHGWIFVWLIFVKLIFL